MEEPGRGNVDDLRRLATVLTREFFETERLASRHCRVEADRLGETEPGRAFAAVAQHADTATSALARHAADLGLPVSRAGQVVGSTLSLVRDGFADLFLDRERSYRGTLLSLRHGIDVVTLYRDVVVRLPDTGALVAFCDGWLQTRGQLADACARSLDWFAAHPDEARAPASLLPLRHTLQAMARGRWLATT